MTEPLSASEAPALFRKLGLRLIPLVALLYLVAFLDRVNIGFAALTMNRDLALSPSVYGFGAGVFFLGYMLFEIPSNIALARLGARLWIARIAITWGVVAACTALITGARSFYVLRFVLGVAESGFFPGIIFYLTLWFPASQRAKMLGAFLMALPLSSALGAPISTSLLSLDWHSIRGWQWLFILEGVPAILLGLWVPFALPNGPEDAKWLSGAEKDLLKASLLAERPAPELGHLGLGEALTSPRVWSLGLAYFGIVSGLYGVGFWLPQIIKEFGGLSLAEIGMLSAVPYAVAALVMFVWGRHSDRSQERAWHVALPAFFGAAGLIAAGYSIALPWAALLALTVSATGIFAALPTFWTLPPRLLRNGVAMAGGIALINSLGASGGFLGGWVTGVLKQLTGTHQAGLCLLGALLAMSGAIALWVERTTTPTE